MMSVGSLGGRSSSYDMTPLYPSRTRGVCHGRRRRDPARVRSQAMKIVRRVLAALMMAGIAAAGIRVKGRGGTPPQHGGWRPLELPDRRKR